MSKFEIIMPKVVEHVQEAIITRWFVKEGDTIQEGDTLLEIATKNGNAAVPSPVHGVVQKIHFKEGAMTAMGAVIAIVNTDDGKGGVIDSQQHPEESLSKAGQPIADKAEARFHSPLVRNIAKQENISSAELESITGTGANGRVRKEDVLTYLEKRKQGKHTPSQHAATASSGNTPMVSVNAGDNMMEMAHMHRMIAGNRVLNKQISPHATSMVEADVSGLVQWRHKIKDTFQQREGFGLSFMPVFIKAAANALRDFPQVNASVDGNNITHHKDVNIGIAVTLPEGHLMMPVIRRVDTRNLLDISVEINRLVQAARNNKLSPDDASDGTFSVANFGSFRNVMGTPVIHQSQAAIMATGSIEKKPAVMETASGDVIAIRSKMILSLSYDYRVVDGALGSAFIRKVADYLEAFDSNQSI